MDIFSSLQLSLELGIWSNYGTKTRFRLQNSESRGKFCVLRANLSSFSAFQEQCGWSRDLSKRIQRRACIISSRNHRLKCHCFVNRVPSFDAANIKSATSTLPSCRFCYFCNMGTQAACQTMQKQIFWGSWLVMQFLLVKTHCCMLLWNNYMERGYMKLS
ncbi:uncharacterized protein LOC121785063 isoform X1 [Salvia splendens]|uniref:uncharacterized protein LOC121785063 isoform X1 n=1 Tax=Salvia splendens TaxID=180675 RepID=UPI001C252F98|nr:uncharacterized protein LOC121785063 isoform X1 [Salvia splendens]